MNLAGHATVDSCATCGTDLGGVPAAHEGKNGPAYCEACFRAEIEAARDGTLAEAMRYRWPALVRGGATQLDRVAALRHLPRAGVDLAHSLGLVRFATLHGASCWVVTDDARQLAQARRMDGKRWQAGAKGLTLRGSRGGWPLGVELVPQLSERAVVLWVEGGPDLLAACTVAALCGRSKAVGVVAMLGASMRPPDETLEVFKGRRVRICRHADEAGARAARNWAVALYGAGAETDVWEPKWPHEDLNDAISDGVSASSIVEDLL